MKHRILEEDFQLSKNIKDVNTCFNNFISTVNENIDTSSKLRITIELISKTH